jgi:hypothetical protein
VVAIAGCGESAAQQFRDSLSPLQQQVQTLRSQIAATLQSVSLNDRRGAQLLDQEIAALAGEMAKMTKLRAPGQPAEHAFAGYNAANVMLIGALRHLTSLVARGTSGQLQAASVVATDAAGAIQRASDALDSALGR